MQHSRAEREETPQERVNRLVFEARRGRRTAQLVKSAWWIEYMEPEIKKRAEPQEGDGLPGGGFWRPGCGLGTQEVALASAFYGGRLAELHNLRSKINEWLKAGEEAEIELKKRNIEI